MLPVTAVIPTRNEEKTIEGLILFLNDLGVEVVVADDSTDDTELICDRLGAIVVYPNGGLGAAYHRAGLCVPLSHSVVHVDAGGSHSYDDIERVIALTREGRWDVVIGSRFTEGGSHEGGWKHRELSRTAARISNVLSIPRVRDWTSGLRGYSQAARHVIADHHFVCEGHAWQIEALDVCLRHGLTYRETPIRYVPSNSQRGIARTLEAVKAWKGMLPSW